MLVGRLLLGEQSQIEIDSQRRPGEGQNAAVRPAGPEFLVERLRFLHTKGSAENRENPREAQLESTPAHPERFRCQGAAQVGPNSVATSLQRRFEYGLRETAVTAGNERRPSGETNVLQKQDVRFAAGSDAGSEKILPGLQLRPRGARHCVHLEND